MVKVINIIALGVSFEEQGRKLNLSSFFFFAVAL